MGIFITNGDYAVFEYPEVDEPEFDIDINGGLFISGYKMDFAGAIINTARRFELPNLLSYEIVGKIGAIDIMPKEVQEIEDKQPFDRNNSVLLKLKQGNAWVQVNQSGTSKIK